MRRAGTPAGRGVCCGSRRWRRRRAGNWKSGAHQAAFGSTARRLAGGRSGDFGGQRRQVGDVEVALQAGRHIAADAGVGGFEQRPHRVDDFGAMGVDQQAVRLHPVAGDMDVAGAFERQGAHEGERVEAEIAAVDVDVVDVEMQQAIGFANDGLMNSALAHLGARRGNVVGGVFDADAHAEDVLRLFDAVDCPFDGFFVIGIGSRS
jgi:hypothetical protein